MKLSTKLGSRYFCGNYVFDYTSAFSNAVVNNVHFYMDVAHMKLN